MALLDQHDIYSLPVYSHDGPDKIVNIVNTFDLLDYLQSNGNRNLSAPIEAVMTLDTDRESYRIFEADRHDTLKPTLEAFSTNVHYALVIDYHANPKPTAVLTQTDIVRYVARHPESLHGLDLDASIEQIGLLDNKSPLVTVTEAQTALEAFAIMNDTNLTSVPVIDRDGKICTNLRAFDSSLVAASKLDVLAKPVTEFLAELTSTTLKPVTCRPSTSLREVIDGVVASRTHHVWVVDDQDQAQQVVSLTDLIRIFRQAH
ncbi:hypothetical protein THASP1DRAFT_21144 [Thamnocephalis sphaerospora]|uniref:CBS domain-containing protein n=1 Tax=Thamnocephalis sphaerospora TaxID=78915 RepID=A0A4P9XFR1_9FUNG|nr:hypothetical protein THASP1DRAFT_21144 [Thamnocephalis sphaerospora]|eukprot:RKP04417.1 hypothetical protein THASP1DRAFT_21144 [Thamnocephalis sphaerospora]